MRIAQVRDDIDRHCNEALAVDCLALLARVASADSPREALLTHGIPDARR
jgi:hypothetical protein